MAGTDEDLEIEIDNPDKDDAAGSAEVAVPEGGKEPAAKAEISADDGIAELKAAREARAALEHEVRTARQAQKDAEERYAQGQREIQSRQGQTVDGHIHQLTSTRDALNNRLELLERDYAEAGQSGDYAKMAKVQREMAQRGAEIVTLNQGIYNLEQQKRAPAPKQEQPKAEPAPQQGTMSAQTKKWIDDHRDVIQDPVMYRKMIAGHHDAIAEGMDIDSPEYFEHVEKRMGLKKDEPAAAPQRKVQSAAPASRSSPTRSDGKVQVSLTAEQRRMARDLGLSDAEYAAGYEKMRRANRLSTQH